MQWGSILNWSLRMDGLTQFCNSDGCWGYIWSASQHQIWLSLPSAMNGYLGLHKARLASADHESIFKNREGSTDSEIRAPFVLHQPCNKDGKSARKGRGPQQCWALENSPCWGHGCFLPSVHRAPAAHPPRTGILVYAEPPNHCRALFVQYIS